MDHIRRIGLLLILAGLLFSPAEGICLLPIRGPAAGEASNNSVAKGEYRYQAAIKHFGNKSGADNAGNPISKSNGAKIGAAADLSIDPPLGLVVSGADQVPAISSYHGEHFCELRSRPPPAFE
jgi:hypothetical protein